MTRKYTLLNHSKKFHELARSKSPSMLNVAWAAGIFEGEGCCFPGKGTTYIEISQRDPWILLELRELFGGSVRARKQLFGFNPGTEHLWRLSGGRARGFLYTIFSFLSPRRKIQARKALHKPIPETVCETLEVNTHNLANSDPVFS